MKKDVWSMLRRKFPETEYALMQEVSDAAGFGRSRSADYMLVNLWPSRGLAISGIELKSFRNDWLNELKNPKKAENIFQYCDYFWLLTTDDTIAKIEEIPTTWGWMCIKGEKIFIKKDAPKLTPVPVTRNLLCTMLKRAQDKTNFIHKDSISEAVELAREQGQNESDRQISTLETRLDNIKIKVKEFHEASGVDILLNDWSWDSKKIGQAVKFIKDGGAESLKEQLINLEDTAKEILKGIYKGLESIKEPQTTNHGSNNS